MNLQEEYAKLKSEDSHERALAALRLKDSFEEEAGDRLLHLLLVEEREGPFRLACDAVIPKWIVKLERYLCSLESWPFDALRTAWLVWGVRGWRLPSLEGRVGQFLQSEDWILRLAAVNYCHDKQCYTDQARDVCNLFLEQAPGSVEEQRELLRAMNMTNLEELTARIREYAKDFAPLPPQP